jgi:hypothetical protein
MVHQPLVGFFVGFEPVNAPFDPGKKFHFAPLAICFGFPRAGNKFTGRPAAADRFANGVVDVHDGVHWLEIRLRRV